MATTMSNQNKRSMEVFSDAQSLIVETAIFLAADLYNKIYDPENGMGTFETNHTIRDLAITFEKNLNWSSLDDEGRYFEELEKFENKYLESHNRI